MPAKSTFGSASVIPYSSSSGSYKISRSLRFNPSDSAYLSRTPSAAGNRKTWTFSAWVKRTKIGSASYYFLGNAQAPTGTNGIYLGFGSDTLFFGDYATSGWDWYVLSSSLYRDTSAWYHVVAQYDTTQATASERVKLYVNGVRLTAFDGASTYPTPQNVDGRFNQASVEMAIGRLGTYNGNYFDGYMSEVNFIDGQALDSSSFGYTDSITGSWLPKKYVGTYGTNGFYLPFQNQSTTANYFTYSEDFSNVFWTKYLCTCVTNATTAPNGTNTADKMVINNGQVQGQFYTTGSATDNAIWTSSVYLKALDFTTGILYIQKKDGVFAYIGFDLATGTVTDGINGAIGGTITSVGDGWYRVTCTVNLGTGANTTFNVNYQFTGNGDGVKGSYIWGAQLEQGSSAGPYMYTVASVQNPTLALGEDRSLPTGGYNNWVATNLSVTSGAGNDSLLDSPTDYGTDTGLGGEVRGNYCTFNPLKRGSTYANLSNGNLTIAGTTGGAGQQSVQANIAMSSGKWYAEATITTIGAESSVGIAKDTQDTGLYVGIGAFSYGYYFNGLKYNNSSGTSYGASYTSGDVIGVAFDADAGNLVFYKNGVSQGTAFTGLTNGPYVFEGQGRSATSGNQNDWNFGQQAWRYAPPSGFKALCTTNLPIPSIKKSSTGFDAVTYTGNATGQTISSLGFSPNLVWLKSRTNATYNYLFDTVRGINTFLFSNTSTTDTTTTSLISFNSNGFSLGADPAPDTSTGFNASGSNQIAWGWSRSIIAGLDIVNFTAQTSGNLSVSHMLGVAPKMIITKSRTTSTSWHIYHASLGASAWVLLDSTAAATTSNNAAWGGISPTSSEFTYGSGLINTGNIVAYCFSEIEGYSKFGSYTGNASTDGPFVWCGFRPKFVMVKRTDAVASWVISDSQRNSYNGLSYELYANSSNAEGGPFSPPVLDYVSNGFKLRSSSASDSNANAGNFIFAAFAEAPFKYARAR